MSGFSQKRHTVVKHPAILWDFYCYAHLCQIVMQINDIVVQIPAPLTLISTCFLGRILNVTIHVKEMNE